MRVVKICLIYYIFINLLLSISLLYQFSPFSLSSLSQGLFYAFILYVSLFFLDLYKRFNGKLVILYMVIVFLTMLIEGKYSSWIARWSIPLIIAVTIRKNEYKYYRPLFYICLFFFVANTSVSLYERISNNRFLEIDVENEVLQQQMRYGYGTRSSGEFRSLALIGHPLTNANIMSYMAFIIFYSLRKLNIRIGILILGLASLFCFNARASIIIYCVLMVPSLWNIIRNNARYSFFIIIIIVLSLSWTIINFQLIGGRIVTSGVMDESGMQRILTIRQFLTITPEELLFGGHQMDVGENGYLSVIAHYGVIVGGAKIILELLLAYKLLPKNLGRSEKTVIFLSLFVIGSTNNSLYFPVSFPFYIICVTFILKNNKERSGKHIIRLLSHKDRSRVDILS